MNADGTAASESIPAAEMARFVWNQDRITSHGLVTDHRGNVERWLAFVFDTIKENAPEEVELRAIPVEELHWPSFNAVLTLREMNLYQASARAIELVGLLPPPPPPPQPAGSQLRPADADPSQDTRKKKRSVQRPRNLAELKSVQKKVIRGRSRNETQEEVVRSYVETKYPKLTTEVAVQAKVSSLIRALNRYRHLLD